MDSTEATMELANAVKALAEAIGKGNENANRIRLTVFTPSTGGELELKFDPKQNMAEFMAVLGAIMEKREEVLKAGIDLNARLGIGVKKDAGGK